MSSEKWRPFCLSMLNMFPTSQLICQPINVPELQCLLGTKPLFAPIMTWFTDVYMCHSAIMIYIILMLLLCNHDDVIKWKHFPCDWPFVRRIHRPPVNSPHEGQWCRTLMLSLICVWIKDWVNNHEAGNLRCYCAHYDVVVMIDEDCEKDWLVQMPLLMVECLAWSHLMGLHQACSEHHHLLTFGWLTVVFITVIRLSRTQPDCLNFL